MKIKLIDTFCIGNEHVQFNTSLLAMLSIINSKVLYYASKSNKENVFMLGESKYKFHEKIVYKPILVWNGTGHISLLFRYVISLLQNIRFLISSKKSDFLIFNYNNSFSLSLVNLLNKILNRKILIFCHGELEMLQSTDSGSMLSKLLKICLCVFFLKNTKINKNIHFCVLGESVLNNVKKIVTHEICSKFHYIDHPYIYSQQKDRIRNTNLNFVIGIIGSFSKQKGGDSFLSLARKFRENNKNNVKFSITGRIYECIRELEDLGISLPRNKGEKTIPFEEFYERIQQLRYIIFLYPADSYKLIASGAIMDAIDFEIPIIGLKNQYFEYMFSKFGRFGFLFDNIDDIYDFINTDGFIYGLNINFAELKEATSPEKISQRLQTIITNI